MTDSVKPTMEDYLGAAGRLLPAGRRIRRALFLPSKRLPCRMRQSLWCGEFRDGRSAEEIKNQLTSNGWQPPVAEGFIALVSQLLAKMYLQRTYIFTFLSVITSMLASIAVPQAANGEFPWLAAGVSLLVATVCILATLRNLQLYRRFRQQPAPVKCG